jgi:hypothetical protein
MSKSMTRMTIVLTFNPLIEVNVLKLENKIDLNAIEFQTRLDYCLTFRKIRMKLSTKLYL